MKNKKKIVKSAITTIIKDKYKNVKYDIKNKIWGRGVKNADLLECV